jgi:hypothetical protein
VYESPAAGDGLGDGLGDGDGGAGDGSRPGAGLGVGAAIGDAAGNVGVGVPPPTQPHAVIRTVPTISPWTIHRVFGSPSFMSMMLQPYGPDPACATVFSVIEAES